MAATSQPEPVRSGLLDGTPPAAPVDFADVTGQLQARRAAEVAAAGGHNLMLFGPPGAGTVLRVGVGV